MRKIALVSFISLWCLLLIGVARAGVYPAAFGDITTGMKFVFVKGGCYEMGDVSGDGAFEENPLHNVCVNDFYMAAHEVTQGQWRLIVGNSPSHFKSGDEYPVETVSWDDAQEFITKLNRKTGKSYRLPTEAEWEFAARGGAKERWAGTSFESELGVYAWYLVNSGTRTHPVGQKRANVLGLHDMSGNVWEWVQDRFDRDYYGESPKNNPEGPVEGYERLLRGGSWYNNPWVLRTSYRLMVGPAYKADNVGFRLVLPIPPPPVEVKAAPPPPPSPPPPRPVLMLKDINFDFDQYNIRSWDEEALKHDLQWFEENPGKKVKIEGHCDERGSADYNLVLGRKRAEAARSFLIGLGIDGKLLEAVSYGEERPLDPRHNEEAWAKNRRVHLVPVE